MRKARKTGGALKVVERMAMRRKARRGEPAPAPAAARPRKTPIAPGDRFGRLVAEAPLPSDAGGKQRWRFRCDCGAAHDARVSYVTGGRVRSCGCLQKELARKMMAGAPSRRRAAP
jgi:hypothetical protein